MKAKIYKDGSVYVDKGFGYMKQQCFKRAGTSLVVPTKTTTTSSGDEDTNSRYYRTGLFRSRTDSSISRKGVSVSTMESEIKTTDSPNCNLTCPAFIIDGNNINLCCGTLKCTHIYMEGQENISIEDFRKFFVENQDRFLKALETYNPEKRQKSYPRILLSNGKRPCRIDEVHAKLWFDYRYENAKNLKEVETNCYLYNRDDNQIETFLKEQKKNIEDCIAQELAETEKEYRRYEAGANSGPYFKIKRDMDNPIYDRIYWARIEEIFESCEPLEFINWSEFIDNLKESSYEQM